MLEAAFRPFVPQSSIYFSLGNKDILKNIINISVRFICIFGIPIFFALIIWAPELISIWLKVEIKSMTYAIRIIAFAYIFSLLVTPAYYLFMGIGKKEMCFWVYLILAAINFIFVLIGLIFGFISLEWVVNIFALSLIISSIYLMVASYIIFGERYFADIKNLVFISLSIICMSIFKIIGLSYNFHGTISGMLILISIFTYLIMCYAYNLICIDKIIFINPYGKHID
jgi:O-antigen/teichoic acid export membrane protein